MLHILWRSFTQRATGLDETLLAISDLADFVIRKATQFAETQVSARFGEPIGEESQTRQHLFVVGMGKLGGREVNLSSDIEIMFVYDEPGVIEGGRSSTSNQEFFTRVAQLVIKLIDSGLDGVIANSSNVRTCPALKRGDWGTGPNEGRAVMSCLIGL